MKRVDLILFMTLSWFISSCAGEKAEERPTGPANNVFLITLDGLRWQELFYGADSSLISDQEYVDDTAQLADLFWSDDFIERRKLLLPFFWTEIKSKGVILGNRNYGSKVNVTNSYWFSYPGYNEILTGWADDEINSNEKVNNKNETILEFVNKQEGYKGKVAAFASWDVFPYIINEERSRVYVNAGFEPATGDDITQNERLLNLLQRQIPKTWSTVRVDAFTHHFALEYINKHQPGLLYISYGETDDFAHDGRYDQYLKSANQTDTFIRELWEIASTDPHYAGKTSLLITTDHGRGTLPKDTWRSHGKDIAGADQIWIAAIGPGIKSLGESKVDDQFYQNQVSATVGKILDVPYGNNKKTGAPVLEIIKTDDQ